MKFRLVIDKTKDEEIIATVHSRTGLTDQIEALVMDHADADRIPAYTEDDMKMLAFQTSSASQFWTARPMLSISGTGTIA